LFADKDAMETALGEPDADSPEESERAVEEDNAPRPTSILGSALCVTPLLGTFAVGTARGELAVVPAVDLGADLLSERAGVVLTDRVYTTSGWLQMEDEGQKLTEQQMARSMVNALKWRPSDRYFVH
jgi:hypothetical protein